jgi:2-oxoglutarate dehydrogenase E2 component (dihydrolipoamide succinyltransferase)
VKRDEPIFEISTDKVDAEIPSPSAGTLVEIIIGEGKTVSVQTVVARIETEKSLAGAAPAAPVAAAPTSAPAAKPPVAASAPVPAAAAAPSKGVAAPPVHVGGNGGSFEERIRTKSSPLVRRIAAEHGVEISALTGSGIAGRVTKKDLLGFLESGTAHPAAAPAGGNGGGNGAPPAAIAESHAVSTATAWPGDVVEPMTKLRRLTSEHMGMAIRVATHVTTFFEIDLTRVARVRASLKADFEAQNGQKLTYLPFIIQAVVATLKKHPIVNAAVNGNEIIFRRRYNIGLAVALEPTGLIVPVIKHAEDLSLSGIAKAANDLASRARAKKLGPADAQDATFTITNPGVFGSLMGTPIIPVGTTSILGLGTIEKRPKVLTGSDGEDTIAIRTCAYFFLSFDHKVVDGADADRFMGDLKRTLESIPDKGF